MHALDQNLHDIVADVVRMLSLVRESCRLAGRALLDGDVAAAAECARNDELIDALQAQLELTVLTVIARRQPAAGDLRFLGAVYRMLADIERAGDYAEHVAETGAELAGAPPIKKYVDLGRILVVLNEMIEGTIKALTESDVKAARHALAMDDEIDDLYQQIQRELLTHMLENPKSITPAIKLLNVARYLERLGDHLENVNEHIIFWLTGERP
jgi:phosphate transport system protein